MGRLDGKVVVVTGAAGGQGAAEARAASAEGATVIATDLQAPDLGAGITGRQLDVTSREDWSALRDWLEVELGRVDGLINNAGIAMRARLDEITIPELERVMAVNLYGPLLGIQALLPLMAGGASIVNVSSAAGLIAFHGVGYTASKWALRGLSRAASMELGRLGIRVNTVFPGFIDTPMTAASPPSFRGANIDATPLGRAGLPEEVVALVVLLISDEASFINGAEIAIDGGLTAHGGGKWLSDIVRNANDGV